jgi:hypothetical protein
MATTTEQSHEARTTAIAHLREALEALPSADLSIRQKIRELMDEIEALDAPE